jgi:hypothetical protein
MTDAEKQKALESITLIRELMTQSQKEISHSGGGWISIIWGIYCFLGYAGSRLFNSLKIHTLAGLWWPFLAVVAFFLSAWLIRKRSATQSSKIKGTMVRWFVLFWVPLVLLMAAQCTLFALLSDLPVKYMIPFILLVVSTGYIMVGLLFHKSILVMGVLGFAGSLISALFFIDQAPLILTLLFGVGLIITGLIFNRKG